MLLTYIIWIFLVLAWYLNFSFFYSFISAIIFFYLLKKILSAFFSLDLASLDSGFLNAEHSTNNCYLLGCMVFESRLEISKIKQMIASCIVKSPCYEKLKKIIKCKFLIDYWTYAKDFDIENHIEVVNFETSLKLYEFMGKHVSQIKLPKTMPNWKMFIVEKYENDKSAVIIKIDHSFGDGLSILSLILNLGSAQNVKFLTLPKVNRLWFILLYPFGIMKALLWVSTLMTKYKKDHNDFKQVSVSGKKFTFCSKAMDLSVCKKFAKSHGASMNDVLLALITRVFQNLHMKRFGSTLNEFKMFIPTSMRATSNKLEVIPLENESNFVIMNTIPIEQNLMMTTHKIHAETKSILKNSLDFYFRGLAAHLFYSVVPKSVVWEIISQISSTISCAFSNVPGPLEKIILFGLEVKDIFFFIGGLGESGIVTNIMSYDGKVYFGCQVDEVVRINVEEVVKEFEDLYLKELI